MKNVVLRACPPHSIRSPRTPHRNPLTRPGQGYAFRRPLYSHFIRIPHVLVWLPRITLRSRLNSLSVENGEAAEIQPLRTSRAPGTSTRRNCKQIWTPSYPSRKPAMIGCRFVKSYKVILEPVQPFLEGFRVYERSWFKSELRR